MALVCSVMMGEVMRKIIKSAAALALAAIMFAFSGCAAGKTSPQPENAKTDVANENSAAKVLLADMNEYISQCENAGGGKWEQGTIKISIKGREVTVSDYTVNTPAKMKQTLGERLLVDFNYKIQERVYMEAHVNDEGRVWATVYVYGVSNASPADIPTENDFKAGHCAWNGRDAGVAPSGLRVGTFPNLPLS